MKKVIGINLSVKIKWTLDTQLFYFWIPVLKILFWTLTYIIFIFRFFLFIYFFLFLLFIFLANIEQKNGLF